MKLFGLSLLLACTVVFGTSERVAATEFKNCGATQPFADCTTATCSLTSDSFVVNCGCSVVSGSQSGVSVPPGCIAPTKATDQSPATAQSRYTPVPSTGLCASQNTIWAQCLGVTCTVSADGKSAICPCTKTTASQSGGGPYVIVTTDSGYNNQCTNGTVYSSATYNVEVKAISDALGFKMPSILWPQP
jgi:hypothetical protein